MPEQTRLALIGCGGQMRQNLLPFLQRIRGHRIVACVDSDLSLAGGLAELAGAGSVLSTVDELDPGSVDAAVLAVPPEPSYTLTKTLAERGIDCFVEKPAGPSTEALERLEQAVHRTGRTVHVGFNFRYAGALRQLHKLTADGRTRPSALTLDFYSRHPSAPQWGVDTTLEAWIRHNGVHAFDIANWFNPAPVTRVDAHAIPCGDDRFLVTVSLRHENGSLSTLRVGNHTQKFLMRATVHTVDGDQATAPSLENVVLELEAGKPSGVLLHTTRNLDHGWERSGFGPELEAFLRACRGEPVTPAGPSVGDALAASRLCDLTLADLVDKPEYTSEDEYSPTVVTEQR